MDKLPISEEKTSKENGGFTLVELAIVLVIVGLLIGGILAAQSMISTAKISAQIRQIGQFDAMVLNFKSKFNYLPGDAPAFGGDGDGVLDHTAKMGFDDHNDGAAYEMQNFFPNLDPREFPGSFDWNTMTFTGAYTSGPLKNMPVSKLGKEGSFIFADSMASGNTQPGAYTVDKVNPKNVYVILDPSRLGGVNILATTSSTSAVRPTDLLALDSKMDDGAADSGLVISGNIPHGYMDGGAPFTSPLATCSLGASYQVQNPGYECTPLIRIGGSVGDPQ